MDHLGNFIFLVVVKGKIIKFIMEFCFKYIWANVKSRLIIEKNLSRITCSPEKVRYPLSMVVKLSCLQVEWFRACDRWTSFLGSLVSGFYQTGSGSHLGCWPLQATSFSDCCASISSITTVTIKDDKPQPIWIYMWLAYSSGPWLWIFTAHEHKNCQESRKFQIS